MESEEDPIIVLDIDQKANGRDGRSRQRERWQNNNHTFPTEIILDQFPMPSNTLDEAPNGVIDLTWQDGSPDKMQRKNASIIMDDDDVVEVDNDDIISMEVRPSNYASATSITILDDRFNSQNIHGKNPVNAVARLKNDSDYEYPSQVMTRREDLDRKHKRLRAHNKDSDSVQYVGKQNVCKLSPPQAAIAQIQEIFPLVDPDHVLSKLIYPITQESIQSIIQDLLSNPSYPKVKTDEKKGEKFKQVDYANDEYERSHKYNFECYECLLQDFPLISKSGMVKLLHHHQGRYFKTYMHIVDMIKSAKEGLSDIEKFDQFMRFRSGRNMRNVDSEKFTLNVDGIKYSLLIKTSRKLGYKVAVTDKTLSDELKFTQSKINEWTSMVQKERARMAARKKAQEAGDTVECTCCYGDYAFEEMVSCKDGHLFCVDCLRRYAEERVFGNNDLGGKGSTELRCMDTSGCDSWFSRDQLEKSLSSRVMKKYDELQAAIVLEKAGLDGLCKCPQCEFQASLPESEAVFRCPSCDFESCRKCGEPSHIPLRCNEVEKKTQTDARLQVEEAMTQARIRYCPKGCKQGFYKVEGCNKMTCPTCRKFICYICRSEISVSVGYQHFCQTPHCQHKNCRKCPLYSNAEEDDLRASREAGLKAVQVLKADGQIGDFAEKLEHLFGKEERVSSSVQAAARARPENRNVIPGMRVRPPHNLF
mmetsp:Transcript_11166/g.20907  ORF Transcript_11166/g.20907 Transcript_11166/m.20907 type:complete len:703 (+) Transcript_11166:80-2188(+)